MENLPAMSIPALRQPKSLSNAIHMPVASSLSDNHNVILTLKNRRKLVISSDSYHGIVMACSMYKCVFCRTEMELNDKLKETHITSHSHLKCMERYPHLDEFSENLMRKLTLHDLYCSICNVVVLSQFTARHIGAETHRERLEKAKMKAAAYKPC